MLTRIIITTGLVLGLAGVGQAATLATGPLRVGKQLQCTVVNIGKKDVEVLLLTDEIDEWVVHSLAQYKELAFQSVAKGDPGLDGITDADGDGSEGDESPVEEELAPLLERLKDALGERVRDVRVSRRLTSSPACLVVDDQEMSGHLERLLEAAGQEVPGVRPILEVNPDHVMVRRFGDESDEDRAREWAAIFYEQALLSEGGRLEDPAGFVRRMNDMIITMSG